MVAYNAETYLHRSLSHLLSQNYCDYEFIFIDNGSTDGTSDIIKRFHNDHPELSGCVFDSEES